QGKRSILHSALHLGRTQQVCQQRRILVIMNIKGVDEKLKAKDQMAWVGQMNNIRQRAEEIILQELIYG
ncbi:MAG: TnpV protein, partial [Oscillospiraceae bacterium]|nr:TnpV protein [Oscillospiraceae bacterium]